MNSQISDREKIILDLVVSNYIENFEPVGSRTISKEHNISFSPATIRNILSDLETMGYLEKTHSSSGRIPTNLGYKIYVDYIMKLRELSLEEEKEIAQIHKKYKKDREKLKNVIQQMSFQLSKVTKYPGIITLPDFRYAIFKKIQFVSLGNDGIMVFIITNADILEKKFIDHTFSFTQDELNDISNVLSKNFNGKKLKKVYEQLKNELLLIRSEFSGLCKFLHLMIRDYFRKSEEKIYVEGVLSILENPEFNEFDKIKLFLGFLDKNKEVTSIFNKYNNGNDINVTIGIQENGLENFSLVSAPIKFDIEHDGNVGVIGPKRMRYNKVISTVRRISEELNTILKEIENS